VKEFFVVWSHYDPVRDTSNTIYRAILKAGSSELAWVQAASLIPQVLQVHRNSGCYPEDPEAEEIEIEVRGLESLLKILRYQGLDLPKTKLLEDE
jgi:hypothetical protein